MNKSLGFDTRYTEGFITEGDLKEISPEVKKAHFLLDEKNGPGNDLLGWVDLPWKITGDMLRDIRECAGRLAGTSGMIVSIGIGGSYLGARAAIDMLTPRLTEGKVFFAGQNISGSYMKELSNKIEGSGGDFSLIVISKSGTTTEPAVAFRVLRRLLKEKYPDKSIRDRVICVTDEKKGALKRLADEEGYRTFVIPGDIGGRFSVLTPVGLLPIACAGINVDEMVAGARDAAGEYSAPDIFENNCYKYAAIRNIFYRKGKVIEILSSFDDRLHYFSEWWKQLFGESEGKDGKGIFPASCDFTTDLHSMGQLIQDGERNIFETFFLEDNESTDCTIQADDKDLEGLNYLSGKTLSYVNKQAYKATARAHFDGGVPNSTILIPESSAYYLGQLFYFFEKAAAVSAYISGVNPFNQPGVESYKNKMFKLLGKP